MKRAQKFHITESQLMKQSGYSRHWLQKARLGHKQVHNGKMYVYPEFLARGVHYDVFGRAVLYSDCAVEVLRLKKGGDLKINAVSSPE